MTGVRFGVLGPLIVENGRGQIDVGSPKQRAVLAVLLLNANRPLTPERLIDALWGEHPPQSALATLQAYISNLRRAIEPERTARSPVSMLAKNGGGYQLSVDDDMLDSLRFERLVARATDQLGHDPETARALLVEAMDLWRGPPLADFTYSDFARTDIARLDELRLTGVEMRIAADLALGRSEELVAELEALTTEHPLRERLWSHLMLSLYRTGRQAEALRAYRRLEETLAEELGIVPSESLRRLELDILNQDPSLVIPHRIDRTVPAERGGVEVVEPHRPPFRDIVGRTGEINLFHEALFNARIGYGSMLLFEGEPGIGKSRLLESLQHRAVSEGYTSAFARCVEVGGTMAFWPWIQLVRQLGSDVVAAAAGSYTRFLAPLFPDTMTPPPYPGSPVFRLAEGLASALNGAAGGLPLVLFIDDLYAADPDSLSVLSLLAAEIERLPLVVVGSHRGTDLGASHPFTHTLEALSRLQWVTRHRLSRFDETEVAEIVNSMIGSGVDAATTREIYSRTEGNAFFTIELVKLLHAEQCLSPERAATAVPATVLEVMTRRLDRLSADALHLIRTAATYGREFDLVIAAETLGVDVRDVIDAVDEIIEAGFVTEIDQPGTYRFSHVIIVNSILATLGSARRAVIHTDIADALERRYSDDPSRWMEIAHHRREAVPVAGPLVAGAALARAGRHALDSNALELAEEVFTQRRALVRSEPHTAGRDQREIDSLLDLGRVWTWHKGYHSHKLEDAAARLWVLTGLDDGTATIDRNSPITPSDPVLATLQMRFSHDLVAGDYASAKELALRFRALHAQVPDPMIQLAASIATLVVGVSVGDVAASLDAIKAGEEALAILDPKVEDQALLPLHQQSGRVSHHSFAGWAYWLDGDEKRSRNELSAAMSICDRSGHPYTRAFCTTTAGIVAAMSRSPQRVVETVEWGRSVSVDGALGLTDMWSEMLATWGAGMMNADPVSSATQIRDTLQALAGDGAMVAHTLFWGLVAELELRADRADYALEAVETGLERTMRGERFWYPELERLGGVALRRLGRVDDALSATRRAAEAAHALGIRPLVARMEAAAIPG